MSKPQTKARYSSFFVAADICARAYLKFEYLEHLAKCEAWRLGGVDFELHPEDHLPYAAQICEKLVRKYFVPRLNKCLAEKLKKEGVEILEPNRLLDFDSRCLNTQPISQKYQLSNGDQSYLIFPIKLNDAFFYALERLQYVVPFNVYRRIIEEDVERKKEDTTPYFKGTYTRIFKNLCSYLNIQIDKLETEIGLGFYKRQLRISMPKPY